MNAYHMVQKISLYKDTNTRLETLNFRCVGLSALFHCSELFFHSDLKPLISTSNQHKTSYFKPVFKWFLLAFYIDTHRKSAQKY